MNMALMKQLRIRAAAYQCPKTQPDKTLSVPILDAATEAVALIQSVLGLFANSESVAGVQGTIQDQALMDGVARHLRGLKVPVLMPDTYAPYTLGGLDFKNSPFLSSLGNLMVCRVCLQALLRDPDLQVTKTDLDNLTAQRKTLSDQLEADQKEVKAGFRIYDLRSTYATRLSAGGVADEWVTQMLRQGDAQVFKKYSQMKLQMKREALEKINRRAGEMAPVTTERMCTVMIQ
jgi:hypothetical protein